MFLAWAAERDLTRAGQITRPILESFQRWLWRSPSPTGSGWAGARNANRLGILKDFFRWLTRQNVILHNPASELELPRHGEAPAAGSADARAKSKGCWPCPT